MLIAILGFGREGRAVLKFLKKSPEYKHSEITILDKKNGPNYLKNLGRFDIIFRSPGVPYNLPEIQFAIKNGIEISSATKLFFQHCPTPIIGITGTKGKSTTATLIYKILRASGFDSYLAGNIGKPALEILPKLSKKSLVVLELSSFQLQDLKQSPQTAVVLDIFPDHLDAHKNWKEYLDSKKTISKFQNSNDLLFYFKNNRYSKLIANNSRAKKIGIMPGNSDPKKNIEMAEAVAKYFGCPENIIKKTIENFRGLKHRLEFIRKIGNIKFYNDSAATNPEATAAAIRSFNTPIILIAGGKDKKLNYAPLAKAIKESDYIKQVILFGENKRKINGALTKIKNRRFQIIETKNFRQTVVQAYQTAKFLTTGNQRINPIVLFSPASASFDMFNDYKDRGKKYKDVVRSLKI